MGIGPVPATLKALSLSKLEIDKIQVIELNEAFSSQSLAVINSLNIDSEKVNVDGGALSIGHPLGASGARITGKAALLMNRLDTQYSLATMCIGGGMGITSNTQGTILE